MNTWLDKYESEPQPMWIEEFQDNYIRVFIDGDLKAEYMYTDDMGIDGSDHYFKIFYRGETKDLTSVVNKFAQMFYYDCKGPGCKFINRHSLGTFNDFWMLKLEERYDN